LQTLFEYVTSQEGTLNSHYSGARVTEHASDVFIISLR